MRHVVSSATYSHIGIIVSSQMAIIDLQASRIDLRNLSSLPNELKHWHLSHPIAKSMMPVISSG